MCTQQGTASVESSIIIPVFNQWELTRACLKALAETTQGRAVEVIVIDNASSDVTPEACPFLGKQLFGDAFRYVRCTTNRNFGPASNMGAAMARGQYLIFLNNDTVPQPGWYAPLIKDFARYPNIAATGPLLLYPAAEPFGHTVQHLGVYVTPNLKVGHLYEGIPAQGPLVRKRRFFQIITAACMVMPRSVFLAAGMFDEGYVNGGEDVDLCARLFSQGLRMTVNPAARVVHHTSQTPGRHEHEAANFAHLKQTSLRLLVPDWHLHLASDGMRLSLDPWLNLVAALPQERQQALQGLQLSSQDLQAMLVREPFWQEGWFRLASLGKGQWTAARLYPSPECFLALLHRRHELSQDQTRDILQRLLRFCLPYEDYVVAARSMQEWCADIGLTELAQQYAAWLASAARFRAEHWLPCVKQMRQMLDLASLPEDMAWLRDSVF
ncbi:MAG: glycosyltransferase family 2 protein [Desulfovibrio sp.]|nr:glycosyltransferase family 2 protein [Desulfovibrio sp.]